jgi:hypothetical protein
MGWLDWEVDIPSPDDLGVDVDVGIDSENGLNFDWSVSN